MPPVPAAKLPAPPQIGAEMKTDWIRLQEDWKDYELVLEIANKEPAAQVVLFHIALRGRGMSAPPQPACSQKPSVDSDMVDDDTNNPNTHQHDGDNCQWFGER